MSFDKEKDEFEMKVTVTNDGDAAGKDVVEAYFQSPYTQYDVENGIEKASVELCGFAKTKLLQPGESETVTITVPREEFKAYDAKNAKTYVLDDGDYYVTAATNAHTAVNNILAAKDYTTADGMDADGDPKNAIMLMKEIGDILKNCNSENGDFRSEEYESGIPKYTAENTNAELLAIAEEYGIDIPAKATKAQIIEALDSYFGDMPVLTAKEPEE